ncbi:unnamed protein product [Urochloa humidicola]
MANFQCNPNPYLPPGAHVEDGWLRPARSRVALGGEPPRRHEDYAIITLHPQPADEFVLEALRDVVEHLEDEFPVRILSHYRSPLGLGLVQFQSASQRQSLIDLSPIPFFNNSTIRVIKHDEARNQRACNYTRLCRLMVLAFPLDYQTMDFFKAAVAPFGRLITWYESPNKSKTILDCLVLSPHRIPRSMVVSQGSLLGGNGRSWTAPVYIIGGQFPDGFPADEDPVPVDGNPHPAHGFIAHANPDIAQHWIHELNGAANEVLQDHGVNPDQLQQAVEDLEQNLNNADAVANGNEGWPEWDVDQNGGGQQQQAVPHAVPQHPAQPQDTISFDQSGSSAYFLRANGPDVNLSVEMIQQGQLRNDSSSSSSEVSSVNQSAGVVEQHLPRLSVNWSAFDNSSSRVQPGLAEPSSLKRSWSIAFDVGSSSDVSAKAIVPYQPVLHAVLLQIWAQKMDDHSNSANIFEVGNLPAANDPAPAAGDSITDVSEEMVTGIHGTHTSMQVVQEEQLESSAKKCLLSAFEATSQAAKVGLPPRPPKKVVSLPTLVSAENETVPLVTSTVRRSPRLNKSSDGYKHCQLVSTPRKKRKGKGSQSMTRNSQEEQVAEHQAQDKGKSPVKALKNLKITEDEVQGPIPMETLKGWGVECGVSPGEITEDLLLHKATTTVPDDATPNTSTN